MQDIAVTLVQANQLWEDKEGNFENYARLLHKVERTQLILLPEMFNTGFSMNTSLAEEMHRSESLDWLRKMASNKQCAVYTSLMIREHDTIRNRGVFVMPNGQLEFYDKRKSFGLAHEDRHFRSGSKSVIVHYLGWKFMLQICYDLRFPEISRNKINPQGTAEYDAVLYVANWPENRIEHWNILLRARAIENQCFSIGVNRVGKDGSGHAYSGNSQIVDALGQRLEIMKNSEGTITMNMHYSALMDTREKLPFLKDRSE